MKKFYILFIILSFTNLFANKRIGEAPISCAKPDGFLEMSYSSDSVERDEISNISISFKSHLKDGMLNLTITKDSELEIVDMSDKRDFKISDGKNYTINLKVRSKLDGIFYVKLLAKVSNEQIGKSRYSSFVVPVDIGDVTDKSKTIRRLDIKENLIIFKAKESVSGII